MICLLLLLAGLLSSNTFAAPLDSNGSLRLQVVAGLPRYFNDPSLTGGKYPAGDATVSIYKSDLNFSFEDYTNYQGQLMIRDLPAGLNKYQILFWDYRGDIWSGEGSLVIKNGELSTKLVELKRETWSGG
ncbi:MAG: hypothetical protein LUQ38_02125 [Methanotrichaceae archaeon]|nr:hypothetical protein [Methanotrichaceae archaeon]